MDYTVRYGLEFNPFLKNSKEIFVSTDESKEVLFRLNYLAKTKASACSPAVPAVEKQLPSEPGDRD